MKPPAFLNNPRVGWITLILVALVTAFFVPAARLDRIDNQLEDNVLPSDTLDAYYRFLKIFGNDRILLVGIPIREVDRPLVRMLFKAELELSALENVQTVLSPITLLRTELGVRTWDDLEEFLSEPRQLERYLENLKKTTAHTRVIISEDWKTCGLIIRLKAETGDLVGPSIAQIREVLDRNLPLGYHLTGIPEITRLILELTRRDQKLFSPITILVMGIVLFLIYRSWFGILFPLLAVVGSFIWTKGTMIMMGHSVNFVTAILPPMILSVALTICIHILTEYYESSRGRTEFDPEILWDSLRHVFYPILLASGSTVVGFGSLIFGSIGSISQFGLYSALGTTFATILALLVIPAGIATARRTGDSVMSVAGIEAYLERLARWCLSHTRLVWAGTIILLGVAGYGIAILPIETSLIRFLPEKHAIQDANRFVEQNLSGIVPIEILLESQGPRFTEKELIERVRLLQEALASQVPLLDKTLSYVDLVQDFDRLFSGEPNHIPRTEEEICDYLNFYAPALASETEDEEAVASETTTETEARLASETGPASETTPASGTAATAEIGAASDAAPARDIATAPETATATRPASHPRIIPTEAPFQPFVSGGILGEFLASDAMTAHVALRFRDRTSRELVESFAQVRALVQGQLASFPVRATITGRAAMWAEVSQLIAINEITSFGMAMVVIILMMMIYFRSVRVGLVAILPNVVPVIYTYGLMGLTGTPFSTATGMIASIAIGLAVDDTIHIICQYQHEITIDGDEKEALVRTMIHKGRATYLTMLPLCSGFAVLMLSSFAPTRYFGIFISIGVTLDLLCELIITPVAIYTLYRIRIPERFAGPANPVPPASPASPAPGERPEG